MESHEQASRQTVRRCLMKRQKILGITALALAIANLVAMPDTLTSLREFSGGDEPVSDDE
jgi:hypothetical protein